MRDWFFHFYLMNNAALLTLTVSWTLVGLIGGFIYGHTRATREYERERSMRNHPSNQR